MAYWAKVARRAWLEAAKTLKLDSRKLFIVLVLGQVVVGAIIYLALGADDLPENLLARGATIAAPLLLFVPLFIWESSPPRRECMWSRSPPYSVRSRKRRRH